MPAMGEKIGNYLGTFFMVDQGLNGDCLGSLLHIRVGLNILEPLKQCVMLRLAIEEPAKEYEIEYERIPFFSFFCERLDHVGSHYGVKLSGAIAVEQYCRWKTMIKYVCLHSSGYLIDKCFVVLGNSPRQQEIPQPLTKVMWCSIRLRRLLMGKVGKGMIWR